MSKQAKRSPFELLLDIECRSKAQAKAKGLPVQSDQREEWHGVAFRLRDASLIVSMTQVEEIVSHPIVASVPWVKPWVLGLANMRGKLLPILDLQGFIYGNTDITDPHRQSILVMKHAGVTAGLTVDSVLGVKHLKADDMTNELPLIDDELRPYIQSTFLMNEQSYAVFNLQMLVENELFMNVAV